MKGDALDPIIRLDEIRSLMRRLLVDGNPDAVLRRIAQLVRQATDAVAVNIERLPRDEGETIAVVSAGPDVATPEELNALLEGSVRLVISLGRRSQRIGAIVIWRDPAAQRVPNETVERIADLADIASLALRSGRLEEDLRRAHEERLRTIETKFRLITGISDELKERLGVAAEYVQLLDTEKELSEREARYIARSRESIDSAVHLITEFVQLSRAEAGHLVLQPEAVNIGSLVRGVARDYQLEIGTIGVEFQLELPDPLPIIVTDIDAVRQVLDNLLSNAVRYTPAGGSIRVHADIRPGRRKADPSMWVCLSVTDTGPGIGDKDLIFEEVYRVERRGGAPGFRLAISRRIARLLGGELSLEPTPGDHGSTFTLWLPATPPAAMTAPVTEPSAAQPELPFDDSAS